MNSLEIFIRINGKAACSPEELLAFMEEPIEVSRDTTLHGWGWIYKVIGPENGKVLGEVMLVADRTMHATLAGAGLDFSDPYTQAQITALEAASAISAEWAAALRGIGIQTATRWPEQMPTLEEIATAQAQVIRVDEIAALGAQIAAMVGAASLQGTSTAELKSAIAAVVG